MHGIICEPDTSTWTFSTHVILSGPNNFCSYDSLNVVFRSHVGEVADTKAGVLRCLKHSSD